MEKTPLNVLKRKWELVPKLPMDRKKLRRHIIIIPNVRKIAMEITRTRTQAEAALKLIRPYKENLHVVACIILA